MKKISVIIPAYNEEGNIRLVLVEVTEFFKQVGLSEYEILVVDDASRDKTVDVVKDFIHHDHRVRLLQNKQNQGLGYNYRFGLNQASSQYAMLIPGDQEVVLDSLTPAIKYIDQVDVIIPFALNPEEVRTGSRLLLSRLFTWGLNFLFRFNLKYYNGPVIARTKLAIQFVSSSASFAYMAVMLVKMLKAGACYEQTGFLLRGRPTGKTKAFSFKNIVGVFKDIATLYCQIGFKKEKSLFEQLVSFFFNKK